LRKKPATLNARYRPRTTRTMPIQLMSRLP
jgi:hypothetical protein